MKTPTALRYDKDFKNVESWGYEALTLKEKPRRNKGKSKSNPSSKPVERFKLHLYNIPENEKPILPEGITYKKAITDYLKSMGKFTKF